MERGRLTGSAAVTANYVVFTGQTRDMVSELLDSPCRKYNPTSGRWLSPDPAGLAAADPSNPQSWNR
jgi:RHS repeat-associated protein